MADAVIDDYKTSLDDLTFNSKPHINALTMLAEEYLPHAEHIVRLIEAKLNKALPTTKLPLMYLMDSIVKNVGGNYTPLFAKNLVKNFYGTFDTGDEKTKICLHKLRSTWDSHFPLRKLYELDGLVHSVDPNWPVKPLPANLQEKASTSIHVNPKFLKKNEAPTAHSNAGGALSSAAKSTTPVKDSVDLKQDLINKQKQLLELQQQKLLLELEQTKQQLALREKRNQISAKKQNENVLRDPRVKQSAPSTVQPNFKVTVVNGQKVQTAGAHKDPRGQVSKPKSLQLKVGAPKKEISEDEQLRAKLLEAQRKSPRRANELKIAKSANASKTAAGATKKSPTNVTKGKSGKTVSPRSGKLDAVAGKKTKMLKKKGDVTTTKKLTPTGKTQTKSTAKSPEISHVKEHTVRKAVSAGPDTAKVKKRDRPPRRSPSHGSVPPAKQARRSTSIERRRSMTPPPRRRSDVPLPETMEPVHSREIENVRPRDPRRSREGSLSPRFSPEPDEMPQNRPGWKPPVKRARGPAPAWPAEEEPGFRPPLARRRSSIDPNVRIPQELTLSHQAEILKQAEIQLQTGQLTHDQHQELLKQLHQLFELQRLRNMQMIEPGMPPHQQHFQPGYPMQENMEGGLQRRRGSADNQHDLLPMQGGDHMQAFRPPPSPPHMEPSIEMQHFRQPPHIQRHSPNRMHDPRQERPPMIRERLPPRRDPRGRGHRPRNVRGPPDDQRRGQRGNFQRRNSRDMEDHMRLGQDRMGPLDPEPHVFPDDGPYVYDEKRFPHSGPPPSDGFFPRGGSPVIEEPFLSGPPNERRSPPNRPFESDMSLRNTQPEKESLPHSEGRRVPLRVYASHDVPSKRERSPGREAKRTDLGRRRRTPPGKPTERKSGRRSRQSSPKPDKGSDTEGAPLLEEPEDYIIASIPPEAEVYHKHSLSLKRRQSDADKAYREHKRNILLSTYTKKLASEGDSDSKDDGSMPEPCGDAGPNAEEALPSPDMIKKEKIEEEVNKSPSLPLKKRKYLVSASEFPMGETRTDSSDGGPVTESEPEPLDPSKKQPATDKDDVATPVIEPRIEPADLMKIDPAPVSVKAEPTDDEPATATEPATVEPSTVDAPKVTETDEAAEKPSVPEKQMDTVAIKVEKEPHKSDKKDENLGVAEDMEKDKAPETKKEKSASAKKHLEKKKADKLEKKASKAKPKLGLSLKKEKARTRERGKGIPARQRGRQQGDRYAQMEEERLQTLMREEERRLEWEAELQKQLEIEELEREMDGRRPPDAGAPPRRGHGRRGAESGPWERRRGRGRFSGGRGGRGRGWGRMQDDPYWDEEMDSEAFAGRGGPMDDGPPFPGRQRPGRERMIPRPHERQAMMRERLEDEQRGWHSPDRDMPNFRSRPGGPDFDRPWNEGPGGPGDRFRGPHTPYNPEDRMPHGPGMGGAPYLPGGSPRREGEAGPYTPFGASAPGQGKPGTAQEMNQVNVNKLLQDLLTMGIIPGNKPTNEKPASGPPSRNNSPAPQTAESLLKAVTKPQTPDSSSVPGPSTELSKPAHVMEETRRVPTPVFHEEDLMALDPDANIPEISLADVSKLKIRCDELIKRLYTGIQCSACGMRFTACQTDVYAEHLDWHYRINRKDRDGIKDTHRALYPSAGDWIMYEEIADPSQRAHSQVFDETSPEGQPDEAPAEPVNPEDLVVPVKGRPGEDKCAVCGEAFKTVYNDEEDEWQYVSCVTVEEKNFHPSCYADHNDSTELAPLPTPVRVLLYNPIEQSLKGIPGLGSLDEEEKAPEEKENESLPEQNPEAQTETQMESAEGLEPETSTAKPSTGESDIQTSIEEPHEEVDVQPSTAKPNTEELAVQAVQASTDQPHPEELDIETSGLVTALKEEKTDETPSPELEQTATEDDTTMTGSPSNMEAADAPNEEAENVEKTENPQDEVMSQALAVKEEPIESVEKETEDISDKAGVEDVPVDSADSDAGSQMDTSTLNGDDRSAMDCAPSDEFAADMMVVIELKGSPSPNPAPFVTLPRAEEEMNMETDLKGDVDANQEEKVEPEDADQEEDTLSDNDE